MNSDITYGMLASVQVRDSLDEEEADAYIAEPENPQLVGIDISSVPMHTTALAKMLPSGKVASRRATVGVKSENGQLVPMPFDIAIANYRDAFPAMSFTLLKIKGRNWAGSLVDFTIGFNQIAEEDYGDTTKFPKDQVYNMMRTKTSWFGSTFEDSKGVEHKADSTFVAVVARLLCHYHVNGKEQKTYYVAHDCPTAI